MQGMSQDCLVSHDEVALPLGKFVRHGLDYFNSQGYAGGLYVVRCK